MESRANFESIHIPIRPIGSYFEVDSEGYIINPASQDNIQAKWQPIMNDVTQAYHHIYGERLDSVYVRGSVAKGQAVEGVSDVDTFAYVDLPKVEINQEWRNQVKQKLAQKYPFAKGVELKVYPLAHIKDNNIILNQSVSIWGNKREIPKIKVGKGLALHAPSFGNRIDAHKKSLLEDKNEGERKRECVWFMKGLLRVGFEITMERSKKYTRDLYRCYETFSEYYPEKELEMREVLGLALNPTTDKQKIEQVDEFAQWLLQESRKYF